MSVRHNLRPQTQSFSNVRRSDSADEDVHTTDIDDDISMSESSRHTMPSASENNVGAYFRSYDQRRIRSELERQRRRDLAIMYELLRLCISEKDLRTYLRLNINKSVEEISYAEILSISAQKLKSATRDYIRINHVMQNIEELERLSQRLNIPIKIERPAGVGDEFHQQIANTVKHIIDEDTR